MAPTYCRQTTSCVSELTIVTVMAVSEEMNTPLSEMKALALAATRLVLVWAVEGLAWACFTTSATQEESAYSMFGMPPSG